MCVCVCAHVRVHARGRETEREKEKERADKTYGEYKDVERNFNKEPEIYSRTQCNNNIRQASMLSIQILFLFISWEKLLIPSVFEILYL